MSLPEVNVNITGGLGLPLAGEDHITGLLGYFDPDEYPTGILKKWVTATAYLEGDVLEDDTDQKLYTVQGDYTSDTTVAADVSAVDLVEITGLDDIRKARVKQIYANGLTDAGIIEGGVADDMFYILDNYFKANPDGYIWLGCYSQTLATVDFIEISECQLAASGKLRKLGIWGNANAAVDFALIHLTSIQAEYDLNTTAKTPLSMVYCPRSYNEAHGSFLDLRSTGNNKGVSLFNSFDYLVNDPNKPGLGTYLGFWATSKVSESIGHVGQYNFVQVGDLDNLGILDTNGIVKYEDFSNAELTTLDDKGYNFLLKYPGYFGSYLNFNHTCSAISYSFNRTELVTTTDKASRNIRLFCLPLVGQEVVFNDDGTLKGATIGLFQNAAERALRDMQSAAEISAYEVNIDPAQKVLVNNNIDITANVVVNGISKTITVNLTIVQSL